MIAEEMKHSCYRENVAEKTGQERAQEGSRKNKNHIWKSCLTADSMRRSRFFSERFFSEKVPSYSCAVKGLAGERKQREVQDFS